MDFDSDSDVEEEGKESQIENWLDEVDDEEEEVPETSLKVVETPRMNVIHKSKYIVENANLFYALCEVDDLGFDEFSEELQESLMKTLEIESYEPGENVFLEKDNSTDVYFVVATEETEKFAEVEVVAGSILEGNEVFLTRLHRGQYFGQKYFVTKRAVCIPSNVLDSLVLKYFLIVTFFFCLETTYCNCTRSKRLAMQSGTSKAHPKSL